MSRLAGPVLVIGTGLLGTSVALACRRAGIAVSLLDSNAEHLQIAEGLGAGRALGPQAPDESDPPRLVVVAVPPDLLGAEIAAALVAYPGAVVTDVGSVKTAPLALARKALGERAELLAGYVGGHPMAGSERSGPLAASAALFEGRPWAVTPHDDSLGEAVDAVLELVRVCGATPVELTPDQHDLAVARVSHVPHLLSVVMAGRLADAPGDHLALAGQGLRDVTRIAGSDPRLWQQILALNAEAVTALLEQVRDQVDVLIDAVARSDRSALGRMLRRGVVGTRVIPAKHGGIGRPVRSVFVVLSDEPGELRRLFTDADECQVNIEDVRIDHDPGRAAGLVELVVDEMRADHLLSSLESRGWVTHR